ncbi:MAG: glutathione peroxidase [Bdellovibrionales bacterium]|nr:glutathione peroxidase [Bdellovibrionales bacterium]NQZ18906.1 glutathione peroxidase [Bdellovibrionales bacterium]
MRKMIFLSIIFCFTSAFAGNQDLYSIKAKNLQNQEVDFSKYKGKVILAVNTASRCGYTPQLKGLQALQDKYGKQGLEVIGFPSNDFRQEDMDGQKLKKFCKMNYGVNFTMMRRSSVNGPERNDVYKYLVGNSSNPKEDVSWNFEKFLVDKSGKVVGRYKSNIKPSGKELVAAIEKALKGS